MKLKVDKVYKSNNYCCLKLCIPMIHTGISNPICSLREKISTDNDALWREQNLIALQIRDKIHGLFS